VIPTRHRRCRPACLLAAATLVTGCAATPPWWQQDLQEWQGAPVSELLEAWGAPLRTLTGEDAATVLVYERSRELDHRFEALADPAARLDPDRDRTVHVAPDHGECTVVFEVLAEHVVAVRHEGGACDIVPRDPARRRTDPEARPRR
jgi:hypothetical protein